MTATAALTPIESKNPMRPDLANSTPLYYVLVEHSRFGSIKTMCRKQGWPLDEVLAYVKGARIERSDYVVIDRFVLGDGSICAALRFMPGRAVMLCCALIGDATEDRGEALALANEFNERPDFQSKFIAVGEFRGNPDRPAH